jgi:hypothetical protein
LWQVTKSPGYPIFGSRNEVRRTGRRDLLDKRDQGGSGSLVIPRRKRRIDRASHLSMKTRGYSAQKHDRDERAT